MSEIFEPDQKKTSPMTDVLDAQAEKPSHGAYVIFQCAVPHFKSHSEESTQTISYNGHIRKKSSSEQVPCYDCYQLMHSGCLVKTFTFHTKHTY